jgi:hypothetical protein
MWISDKDWTCGLIALGVICAIVGYGIFRFIEYIWTHISIGWV